MKEPEWECSNCRFRISQAEFFAIRFDFGCPRCFQSLGLFNSRPVEAADKETPQEETNGPTNTN